MKIARHSDALLLDFHSYPLGLKEDHNNSYNVIIFPSYFDSIYTKSIGGLHPLGWNCESNLYLVEFDHGYSQGSVELNTGSEFIEGYDEISWFVIELEEIRYEILKRIWNKVLEIDTYGRLQMPGIRAIFVNFAEFDEDWYFADKYNQLVAIKSIWNNHSNLED